MASLLCTGSVAYAGQYTADVAAAEVAYTKAAEKAVKEAKAQKAAKEAHKANKAKAAALLSLRQIKNKDIKARLAEGETVNSILTSSNDKDLAFNLIMLNTPKNKLLDLLTSVTRDFPAMAYQAISDVMSYAPELTTDIIKNGQEQGLSLTVLNKTKSLIDGMKYTTEYRASSDFIGNGTLVYAFNSSSGGASCRLLASCN